MMIFAEKLKLLRTDACMTQNELADKLFVTRQAISNYEQGRGYPSIDILVSISKLFNISLDELLSSGIRITYLKYVIGIVALLFAGSVASIISLYIQSQSGKLNITSVTLLLGVYIVPVICAFIYLFFQAFPPKKTNKIYGYRSKASMKNRLSWEYSQTYAALLLAKMAIVLLAITVIYSIVAIFISIMISLYIAIVIFSVHAISLLIPVYFVEKKLKKLNLK